MLKTTANVGLGVCALAISAAACGSSGGSPFGDGAGGSGRPGAGGPNDVFGATDGGAAKPCVNLCLQQKKCPNGGTTKVSGTVFDPAGKVPLYDVIVYVPNAPVAPIAHGASCDRCGDVSGSPLVSAITDTAGRFELANVPVGASIPLVIQVGKWRKQLTVNVPECTSTALDSKDTRLPKSRAEGDIPRIALTTGGADALECFLRKVGLEDGEFSVAGGSGAVHLYAGAQDNATTQFDGAHGGQAFSSAQTLWSDATKLATYDIVLLSCEGGTYPETKPQAALDALYDYTAAGGRVFASHWHRYWFDPQQDNNGAVTGTTKFTDLGSWNDMDQGFPASIAATVETTFPKGRAMHDWLGNVNALVDDKLPIEGAKKNLESVNAQSAQKWITYDSPAAIEYMSFNVPEGVPDAQKCGRVVYSDLHVSEGVGDQHGPAWPGGCQKPDLSPQEKALEFMLFDLSACLQSDQEVPSAPVR